MNDYCWHPNGSGKVKCDFARIYLDEDHRDVGSAVKIYQEAAELCDYATMYNSASNGSFSDYSIFPFMLTNIILMQCIVTVFFE